jgi:hypothetical protein
MDDPQELEKLFAKYPSVKKAFETGIDVVNSPSNYICALSLIFGWFPVV